MIKVVIKNTGSEIILPFTTLKHQNTASHFIQLRELNEIMQQEDHLAKCLQILRAGYMLTIKRLIIVLLIQCFFDF